MKYRKLILFTMLISVFFCGCSKSGFDSDNELCGKWVQENKIDGLPEWTLTITGKEITVYQGSFIWYWDEYTIIDECIITGKSRQIKPYLHLELNSDADGNLKIFGISLDTESGERTVRHTYVKADNDEL
ncbi:MAG: hypothetical protein NC395_07065 [Prevotella sp.]|nr:hypothetical protein [Prevotella sp.]